MFLYVYKYVDTNVYVYIYICMHYIYIYVLYRVNAPLAPSTAGGRAMGPRANFEHMYL